MHDNSSETRSIAVPAAAFEASLALVAIALGWLFHVDTLETVVWHPQAIGWGLLATLPLFLLLGLIVWFPFGPFRELLASVDELVLTMFQGATPVDLAIVSLMAGFGEELLFRGFVQTALEKWIGSPFAALVIAGGLFGLIHAVTRTYMAVAAVVGIYLGWLWLATGNMLAPIVAHAAYDFGALVYLRRTARRRSNTPMVS